MSWDFPPTRSTLLAYQLSALVGAYLAVLLLTTCALRYVARRSRRKLLEYIPPVTPRRLEIAHTQLDTHAKFTGDGRPHLERNPPPHSARFTFPPPARYASRSHSVSESSLNGWSSLHVSPVDADPVVRADRVAMDRHLQDIYAHVLAQDAAKEQGVDIRSLPAVSPGDAPVSPDWSPADKRASPPPAKIRKKPQQLHLDDTAQRHGKTASRTATLMSVLKSPLRSLRTPKTATFARPMMPEEEPLTPRYYISGPLMTIPDDLDHRRTESNQSLDEMVVPLHHPAERYRQDVHPPTRDVRIALQDRPTEISTTSLGQKTDSVQNRPEITTTFGHQKSESLSSRTRRLSTMTTMTTSPLSPTLPSAKHLPGLPPAPTAVHQNYHYAPPALTTNSHSTPRTQIIPPLNTNYHYAPSTTPVSAHPTPNSAVNATGALPLRAYERTPTSAATTTSTSPISPDSLASPTKTTVLERTTLLPSGPNTALRTPWTAGAVPYSPYMPQTPVIPVTPRLITRDERRAMRKYAPRTPVVEMVSDDGEVWGDGY